MDFQSELSIKLLSIIPTGVFIEKLEEGIKVYKESDKDLKTKSKELSVVLKFTILKLMIDTEGEEALIEDIKDVAGKMKVFEMKDKNN